MDYLKINLDGAFRESTHSGGWGSLVENMPFDPGGKGLLSRAAIRDKQGAIKGRPFVAGRLRPAT
jgi:hypothetical protein